MTLRSPRVLVALLTLLLVAAPRAAGADDPKPLPLGAAAPDFDLEGVDGKRYSLASFADQSVLAIIFTCNHCPTAQAYEERIKKLVTDYEHKGVKIVAISPNDPGSVRLDELGYTDLSDDFEAMKLRAKDKGFNFPYLYEGDAAGVSRKYGPQATPHVFVFDKARALRYAGRIDDNEREAKVKKRELRDALDALLAGKAPPVAETKIFGCSVKWAGKTGEVKRYMDALAKEPVTIEKVDVDGIKKLGKNDDAEGKYRLINFWATWCGPCVAEFPDLIEVHRMYRGRPFELVTVCANDPEEDADALAFLKKQQASNRNLLFSGDDQEPMVKAIDPDWSGGLPYTLLVAPGGEVLYRHQGAVDPLELKRTILKAMGREMGGK